MPPVRQGKRIYLYSLHPSHAFAFEKLAEKKEEVRHVREQSRQRVGD